MESIPLNYSEEEINTVLAEQSLYEFIRQAWHIIEPGRVFLDNWHIKCICDHLEAVTTGEIKNLLINIPPRTSKSSIISVMWPVWSWIGDPTLRWITASHKEDLAKRDTVRSRIIIRSDWFQKRWGDRFKLSSDQDEKTRYVNDKTGYRLATSVSGSSVGEGSDIQCLPYDQKIMTDKGEIKIGDIVESKLNVKILSFNHDIGTTEFKSINKYEKSDIGDKYIVEIELESGEIIECTDEHPVYVEGKGYIPAKNLKSNDVVIKI